MIPTVKNMLNLIMEAYLSSANINAVTKGEKQTAMHYAAKNNATASLKSLLRLGANINARDYKMRTPLFVASEAGKLPVV